MSYTWDDYALDCYHEEQQQKAFEEFIEEELSNAIEESPKIRIRAYLAKNGDAIEERINRCINKAEQLLKQNDFSFSLVMSVTAVEIVILYFLVHPLLEGAFTENKLATTLNKIFLARKETNLYRRLMQAMLFAINLQIEKVKIEEDGRLLWETFAGNDGNAVITKRNKVVHQGAYLLKEDALIALKCAKTFLTLPIKVAEKFNMKPSANFKWHQHSIEDVNGKTLNIAAQSPF